MDPMAAMMAAMAPNKMMGGPAPGFLSGPGKGAMVPAGAPGGWSAEKQMLVQRVKDFQKMGITEKKQWEVYCMMKQVQRYDPGSHDENFLNEFFLMQAAGQISADKHESPEKVVLVEKVKNVQKSGPMAKQMWYDFCSSHGNTNFDPARHDESYLQAFLEKVEEGGAQGVGGLEANKVYVGNLEKNVSESDVKEFFSNFGTVTLVELKMDPTGLSRGFAFVTFTDEAPVKFILENKEMMKMQGKQIECKPARDRTGQVKGGWGNDYSWMPGGKGGGKGFGKMAMMMSAMAAMMGKGGKGKGMPASSGGKPSGPTYGVKGQGNPTADSEVIFVGGLPRDATEETIAMHFSQFGTVQKVDMKYDVTTGGFRGFCFVTLGSVGEAQLIFSNYDNNMFNGKWIDCKPAALGKMGDATAVSLPPANIPIDKVGPPPTGSTLRARGLPFSATREQILEFFGGYGVTGRLHIKLDFAGRPSGEVFIEFVSNDEAVRAFHERNFQMMGNRYVELIGASDSDVKTYLDYDGKGGGYGPMKGGKGKMMMPYGMMASFFGGY